MSWAEEVLKGTTLRALIASLDDRADMSTTKTEKIVQLLRAAIAGIATVRMQDNFSQMRFCRVPVEIDGNMITFSMRSNLNYVAEARLDGVTVDGDQLRNERWMPPRSSEFSHWWTLMQNHLHHTPGDLDGEYQAEIEHFGQQCDAGATDVEKIETIRRFNQTCRRRHAFDAFEYLNEGEQIEFEALLEHMRNGDISDKG